MKIIHIIISSILLFFFLSCEKEIKFKGEKTAPYLVVSGYATPDSVFKLHVSKSRFFLDNQTELQNLNDAAVSFSVNGIPQGKMSLMNSNGVYTSNYHPKLNDSISITVEHSLGNANAGARIPDVPFLEVDTVMGYSSGREEGVGMNYGIDSVKTVFFSIHLDDPAAQKNYYRLVVMQITGQSNFTNISYLNDVRDIILNNSTGFDDMNSGGNKYLVFTDELINGKKYTLKYNAKLYSYAYPEQTPKAQMKYVVMLQQVSKDMYFYLKTLGMVNTGMEMFSEPVQVYSNIKGGIGILGGYSYTYKEFEIK